MMGQEFWLGYGYLRKVFFNFSLWKPPVRLFETLCRALCWEVQHVKRRTLLRETIETPVLGF
jgi:hypothetical protein